MNQYIERVVDLLDPAENRLYGMTVEEARDVLRQQPAEAMLAVEGSFALVAHKGKTVRLARSLDRPMRYFLAKRREGPMLVVASRIDAIRRYLDAEGLGAQFHPSYTRMVPAHYVTQLELIGCPDPEPMFTRFFTPAMATLPPDLDLIGQAYIGAAAEEVGKWLDGLGEEEPIGVCFSGGIDSGAVFLLVFQGVRERGMYPGRLKAFTLDVSGKRGGGPDVKQARRFLEAVGLGLFLEPIEVDPASLDPLAAIRVMEDYKPLDVQSATMGLALCRGIRGRYVEWRHLLDGDGGDENLKDYPLEEGGELTIRSVVNNPLLYQEGWGVGRIKHSQTYSGGLSRSYTRTYGPARAYGFEGFSPFTRPAVIAAAEAIPFVELTGYSESKLYALKGEIVCRGVKAITGMDMPVFEKRRFQHGALPESEMRRRLPGSEAEYRRHFLAMYA